jgi:bifunctional oligoribonuclease and PAP phosphatase NrnA
VTALASAYREAAAAIAAAPRILVVAHESPDGDALGSLVAASRALAAAGHDVTSYLSDAVPIPTDLAFLADGVELVSTPPADPDDRLVLALDCGSAARIGVDAARIAGEGAVIVNVDHHHDNTLFGTVDVVDPDAACTTRMVATLLEAMGIPLASLDLPAREALYVGLVTDTGRFQYSNTSPDALRFAAGLVESGVEPQVIFRRVYESLPVERARLIGLAVGRTRLELDGRLALTTVDQADFRAAGAREEHAEGIIDVLRSVRGVEVACVLRARSEPPHVKGSMRGASGGVVDVSAIARRFGGGGHPQAAGFSSEDPIEVVAGEVVRAVAEVLPRT